MVAAAAVVAGAEVVRAGFRGALCRVETTDGDLATDVDVASEEAMRSIIRYRCPGDAIVGEEMGRSGAVDADRVWLLDPLCGTVNFAAGTGLVAVNAALVEGGRVDAAAVADRSVVSSR